MRTITQEKARKIAADFHGGQWSGLYSFCSSGAINFHAINEVENDLSVGEVAVDANGKWFNNLRYKGKNRKDLSSLLRYLTTYSPPNVKVATVSQFDGNDNYALLQNSQDVDFYLSYLRINEKYSYLLAHVEDGEVVSMYGTDSPHFSSRAYKLR